MTGKPQEVSTPLEAEVVEASGSLGAFTMFDQQWTVEKRPPSLMFAELATIDEDDPEAIGALVEVLQHSLGREQYRRFRRAYFAAAPDDGDDSALYQQALAEILQVSTGRPTT